jgi:hypothetical protein
VRISECHNYRDPFPMLQEKKYLVPIMDIKRGRKGKEVWIGLVGVLDESREKLLKGQKGAYVNVLSLASNAADYRRQVKALEKMGLKITEIEDVEQFERRRANYEVDPELIALADEVARTGRVSCGTFHGF